jgi:hypothetical protein
MPTTTTAATSVQTLLLLGALAMLAVGLVLLKIGWLPRRRGSEPHCRRCGYDVTGNVSGRCPECGAELAGRRSVVTGMRPRRAGVALLGFAIALGGLGMGSPRAWRIAKSVEWYHHVPAFWVLRELNSPRPGVPMRAFDELKRRWGAGELNEVRRRQFVDRLLQSEVDQSLPSLKAKDDAFKFLLELARADELSPEDRERFWGQVAESVLRVRPRVRYDERVPWQVSAVRHRAQRQMWWLRFEIGEVNVDGVRVETSERVPRLGPDSGVLTVRPLSDPPQSTGGSLAVQPEGRHTLGIQVSVHVLELERGGPRRLYKGTFPLSAQFEVAPQGTDPVRAVDDPTMAGTLRASISPAGLAVDGDRGQLRLRIATRTLPADIAFDVFLRSADGAERKLGALIAAKGTSTEELLWTGGTLNPVPVAARIVLRSNEYLVRRTLDQFELWKGELVYDDVPVTGGRR